MYVLIRTINGSTFFNGNPMRLLFEPWTESSDESRRWVRAPQSRKNDAVEESSRHLHPDTFYRISETLGALNTVGRYIVNMTRGVDTEPLTGEVPSAIYTLSKNVLGRNVTDTIAPFVREALPNVIQQPPPTIKTTTESSDSRTCTTPNGLTGYFHYFTNTILYSFKLCFRSCDDLSDCPQLLLDLTNLRQSLCFKSLFVPGVCCPKLSNAGSITSTAPTTPKQIVVQPITTQQSPVIQSTTTSPVNALPTSVELVGNVVDPSGM